MVNLFILFLYILQGKTANEASGAGGGGYYGGYSGNWSLMNARGSGGGGGGSSFISGFEGCVESLSKTPIYNKYVFTNSKMISGSQPMPIITNKRSQFNTWSSGNLGNGAVRIIPFVPYYFHKTCKVGKYYLRHLYILSFSMFISQ